MSNSLTERGFLKTVSHSLLPESGNFKLETDYPSGGRGGGGGGGGGGGVILWIIRARQIIRLKIKLERSSSWMDNPPLL